MPPDARRSDRYTAGIPVMAEEGPRGYPDATGRPVALASRGMVSSPHYLASATGLHVLRAGGSAVDACVAMNATLCVVYHHMSGLGGDLFAQVWDSRDGHLAALNGSGRAGAQATIDAYRSRGLDVIEQRGPLSASTVPGTVDAWSRLHERFGRLDWAMLFDDAIHYAADGFPMSRKFRDFIDEKSDLLERFDTTRSIFLPDGRPPKTGRIFRQPALAGSIRLVAERGADVFYRGELCERIVGGLRDAGGLLTADDFASYTSDWVEPLRSTYRGLEVTELPANTQGVAPLMILNLIEADDLRALGDTSAAALHLIVEATKLAFADRDRWVTDPTAHDIPYDELLSKDYAAERRRLIDRVTSQGEGEVEVGTAGEIVADDSDAVAPAGRAGGSARRASGGDTVYLCAVDQDGTACSLIQSIYHEFGSGFVPDDTGIILQNRASFFSLDADHPNALAPGKRTFHTIIPAMALRDGRPEIVFGTMGGEGQPQTQVAMLTRMVDFGYDVQEAIEAPRWLYGRTWGQQSNTLRLEGRIPDGTAEELRRRGHDVEMMEDWSQIMGHAQAIRIDRDAGTLQGGADPRGDGIALGW